MDSLAIVLRVLPRGEDDLFCELFLREQGRRWGIARSARKSRRRFGTVLSPLNILRICLEEKRSPVLFLKEASVVTPLVRLAEELPRLGAAFWCLETLRALVPEQAPEPAKFDLTCAALTALNAGEDPATVRLRFAREILKVGGMTPHLSDCLRCHTRADRYYFAFREGAVFCGPCLPAGAAFEVLEGGGTERIFTPFLEYCIGRRLRAKELC